MNKIRSMFATNLAIRIAVFSLFFLGLLCGRTLPAFADMIPLEDAANYAVLYEGTGGHNLSITNVTNNGNIGVGGTGVVQYSGPGAIDGRVDFSAANNNQFHNTNGSNVGPTSVNYSQANVTADLAYLGTLSSSLAGLGTDLALDVKQNPTVLESTGQLATINGFTYRIFDVTSYSSGDGKLLTIIGDGSGIPVVFNFGFNSNVNLGGDVALNGLNPDQVLWNFTSDGKNVNLNNNASSYASLAFQGIILAPDDILSMTNANLNGRFFGGDSGDMHIVSGSTVNQPVTSVPEPATILLLGSGLIGLAAYGRMRPSKK